MSAHQEGQPTINDQDCCRTNTKTTPRANHDDNIDYDENIDPLFPTLGSRIETIDTPENNDESLGPSLQHLNLPPDEPTGHIEQSAAPSSGAFDIVEAEETLSDSFTTGNINAHNRHHLNFLCSTLITIITAVALFCTNECAAHKEQLPESTTNLLSDSAINCIGQVSHDETLKPPDTSMMHLLKCHQQLDPHEDQTDEQLSNCK